MKLTAVLIITGALGKFPQKPRKKQIENLIHTR